MSYFEEDKIHYVVPVAAFQKMDFEEDRIDHSVSEFYESFGHNLPKIAVVTQGFFGEIVDDVFDRCQVTIDYCPASQE